MSDKEIKIGEKTIGENTKVTLSVKTALWIIGGFIFIILTAFTYGYIDVKDEVENYKQQIDKDKSQFIKTVEDKLDEKLGTFQKNDEEFIREIGDIKGDIKVILDRTGGKVGNQTNNIHHDNIPPDL